MLVHAGDDDNPARLDFIKQAVRKALDSGAPESGTNLGKRLGKFSHPVHSRFQARMNS